MRWLLIWVELAFSENGNAETDLRKLNTEYRFQVHFKAIELPRRHTCPGRLGFQEPEPNNELIKVGCKNFHRPESQKYTSKVTFKLFDKQSSWMKLYIRV